MCWILLYLYFTLINIKPIISIYGAMFKTLKATSCEVMVVPIFEPIITPILFVKLKIPASTKDTSITVTAVLDWMIDVIPAPTNTPLIGVFVNFSIKFLNLSPRIFSICPLNFFIAKRNTKIIAIRETKTLKNC